MTITVVELLVALALIVLLGYVFRDRKHGRFIAVALGTLDGFLVGLILCAALAPRHLDHSQVQVFLAVAGIAGLLGAIAGGWIAGRSSARSGQRRFYTVASAALLLVPLLGVVVVLMD